MGSDDNKPSISISDSRVVKGMATSVIVYTIETKPFEAKAGLFNRVDRKFSDFAWLRKVLIERYPGMFVPSIPAKLMLTPTGKDAEARSRLFSLFLRAVAAHGVLRKDSAVTAFLAMEPKEWGAFMKSCSAAGGGDGEAWRADARRKLGSRAAAAADKELAAQKAHVSVHEKNLSGLHSAAKKIATASAAMHKAVVKVADVAAHYANDTEPGAESESETNTKQQLGKFAKAIGEMGEQTALEPAILDKVLGTGVTFQWQQLNAFKDLYTAREAAEAAVTKHRKKLNDMQNAKASGKTETKKSMFSMKKAKPLDEAIETVEAQMAEATAQSTTIAGALLGSEFALFDEERAATYKELVGMVAVSMRKVQDGVSGSWGDVVEEPVMMTLEVKAVIPSYDSYGTKPLSWAQLKANASAAEKDNAEENNDAAADNAA